VLAHWGRLRIPVGAVVLDPQRQGQQNIQLRCLLRQFQPPRWCRRVVVLADAGFAKSDHSGIGHLRYGCGGAGRLFFQRSCHFGLLIQFA
jgi:hypothetical protein